MQIPYANADLLVEVACSKQPKQGFVGPERVWNLDICDKAASESVGILNSLKVLEGVGQRYQLGI